MIKNSLFSILSFQYVLHWHDVSHIPIPSNFNWKFAHTHSLTHIYTRKQTYSCIHYKFTTHICTNTHTFSFTCMHMYTFLQIDSLIIHSIYTNLIVHTLYTVLTDKYSDKFFLTHKSLTTSCYTCNIIYTFSRTYNSYIPYFK